MNCLGDTDNSTGSGGHRCAHLVNLVSVRALDHYLRSGYPRKMAAGKAAVSELNKMERKS